jgi:hypothetical protein
MKDIEVMYKPGLSYSMNVEGCHLTLHQQQRVQAVKLWRGLIQ